MELEGVSWSVGPRLLPISGKVSLTFLVSLTECVVQVLECSKDRVGALSNTSVSRDQNVKLALLVTIARRGQVFT